MKAHLTPMRMALILTYRCNAFCRHCYFDAGPARREEMKRAEAVSYLDQGKRFKTLKAISLTGGEPFLVPDLLFETLHHASDLGYKTEVVTNCFWAGSLQEARTTLAHLAEAGLDVVNISIDDFHQEFIPFSSARNCYVAANELGFKIAILCSVAKSSELRRDKISQLLGDRSIDILGQSTTYLDNHKTHAIVIETPFIPSGRGAAIAREGFVPTQSLVCGPCEHVLRDIAIDPSGFVLSCCSASALISFMKLGNARIEPLEEIISRANGREFLNTLAGEGPSQLPSARGLTNSNRYGSKCHLCHEALLRLEETGQSLRAQS